MTSGEMVALAHRAVTEGVNLKYVEQMRRALYDGAREIDRMEGVLRDIAKTARWYADNGVRDPHEVDHALCVEVLEAAERGLGSAA